MTTHVDQYLRRRQKPKSPALLAGCIIGGLLALAGLVIAIVVSTGQKPPQAPVQKEKSPQTPGQKGKTQHGKVDYKKAVKAYLEKTEIRHTLVEMSEPESLEGATFLAVAEAGGGWLPSSSSQLTLAKGFRGSWENNNATPWGVRAKYKCDEGFGRVAENDRVFFIDIDGVVVGSVPTENVRIGKPGDADQQKKDQQALKDFLDPDLTMKRLGIDPDQRQPPKRKKSLGMGGEIEDEIEPPVDPAEDFGTRPAERSQPSYPPRSPNAHRTLE